MLCWSSFYIAKVAEVNFSFSRQTAVAPNWWLVRYQGGRGLFLLLFTKINISINPPKMFCTLMPKTPPNLWVFSSVHIITSSNAKPTHAHAPLKIDDSIGLKTYHCTPRKTLFSQLAFVWKLGGNCKNYLRKVKGRRKVDKKNLTM